jgi:hypothetical protein
MVYIDFYYLIDINFKKDAIDKILTLLHTRLKGRMKIK